MVATILQSRARIVRNLQYGAYQVSAGADAQPVTPHLVRPALFQRALIGWAGLLGAAHAHEIGVALKPAALGGGVEHEAHLDVGGGEAAGGEEILSGQRAIHEGQVAGDLGVDAHLHQRRAGFAKKADIKLQQQRQHGRAFGERQPREIIRARGIAGRRRERAARFRLRERFDDGAAFGEDFAVALDQRRFAERVKLLQLRRREARLRIARIAFDLIGKAQFFQQPEHALGADSSNDGR